MANKCQYCGKGPTAGNTRSHSMRATKRTFKPNVFKKNVVVEKGGKEVKLKVKICSKCYKKRAGEGIM